MHTWLMATAPPSVVAALSVCALLFGGLAWQRLLCSLPLAPVRSRCLCLFSTPKDA